MALDNAKRDREHLSFHMEKSLWRGDDELEPFSTDSYHTSWRVTGDGFAMLVFRAPTCPTVLLRRHCAARRRQAAFLIAGRRCMAPVVSLTLTVQDLRPIKDRQLSHMPGTQGVT